MTALKLKHHDDRTLEQDATILELIGSGALKRVEGSQHGLYTEYEVLDASITTALSKSNLIYEGPTEQVANQVRVALVPAEDRTLEADDLVRNLGFTGELVNAGFSYERDGERVGHYYDVFTKEAYDKLEEADLILVTEGGFPGDDQVAGEPLMEELTCAFVPFDATVPCHNLRNEEQNRAISDLNWSDQIAIQDAHSEKATYRVRTEAAAERLGAVGLLTPAYSEAGPAYAHDNEFFRAYNVEVSSAGAPMVTNDQGGKQSYQPGAFELLPPIAVTEVAKVLEHGAAKYEAWNWTAIPSHMHLRSAMGHLFSFIAGDKTEGGDSFNHLTHAATRILFAVEMYARETGRYKKAE
jgi:hypothetical protein